MDRANDESERARWTGRTSSLSRRAFLAMATGLAGGAAISGVLGARRFFEDGAAPVAAQNLVEPPRSIVASAVMAPSAQTRTGGSLPIPPLLSPRLQGGVKVFDLRLQAGDAELIPGVTTDTLGINGPHLGPTLRAQLGD